jgi:hypothetical protein
MLTLAGVCFARLVLHPSALIVDGERPSIDYANPGEPRPVGNDLTFFFLPHHLWIMRVISEFGHLPLWDARGFGGRPMIGNPQCGMFYPPVWAVWSSGAPSALGWLTVGHLIWGGLGVYALTRAAGTSRWAATVAAGAYQASPLLLAHTFEGHYPHVWAACWYPWSFWAYTEVRTGRLRGRLVLPVVLALTCMTGHPQEWLLLVLALSAWSASDALAAWRARGARAATTKLLAWTGIVTFSIGLAAVDIIPQLAVRPWLLHSHDSSLEAGIPRRYHIQPLNGFQLLSQDALGRPSDYIGADNYWETLFSIGLVPLFLGVIAVLRHPDRKLVRGWLALAGLAIWLAGGRRLGLFALVYYLAPGMNWFRVPARSLFLAALAGAVLVGLGVETLRTRMTGPLAWQRFARCSIGIWLIIIIGLFAWARGYVYGGTSPSAAAARLVLSNRCFWLTISAMGALLLAGCLPQTTRIAGRASWLFGVLALAELGGQGHAHLPIEPAEQFTGNDPVGEALLDLHQDSSTSGPLRMKARDSFYGDLPAAACGMEKANINDLFQLDRSARLYETLYRVASRPRPWRDQPMNEAVDDFHRQVRQAVFDRMSISYLVSDRVESDPGWPVAAGGSWHGRPFAIERNPTALPRAYVVPAALVAPDDDASILGHFRTTDPRRSVVMNVDPLARLRGGPRQKFRPVAWLSTDPDDPLLQVTTDAPCLLVMTDSWLPGWTARVDGVKMPVYRGNYAQRVIPLDRAGRHTIALHYQPPGFALGCAITAISSLGWVLVGVLAIRSRRSNNKAPHILLGPTSNARLNRSAWIAASRVV